MHRPEQPVTAAVTREHPTGPVRAVRGRRETEHQDPGVGVTEPRDRLAPVRLVAAAFGLVLLVAMMPANLLAMAPQRHADLARLEHEVIECTACPRLRDWCADPGIDAILTTGGTGLTGRDVTVEAHRDVYEKEIEAFGTVFTIVSMQKIGTSAVQSRATGGVANGTYLFALPGSPSACRDAWDEILGPQLDYRHRPCNFVEILPRLDEHLRRKK